MRKILFIFVFSFFGFSAMASAPDLYPLPPWALKATGVLKANTASDLPPELRQWELTDVQKQLAALPELDAEVTYEQIQHVYSNGYSPVLNRLIEHEVSVSLPEPLPQKIELPAHSQVLSWIVVTVPADIQLTRHTEIQADEVVLTGDIFTEGYTFRINTRALRLKNPAADHVVIGTFKNPDPLPAASGRNGLDATKDNEVTDGSNGISGRDGQTPSPIVIEAEYIKGEDNLWVHSIGENGQRGGTNGVGGLPVWFCDKHKTDDLLILGTGRQSCPDCRSCKGTVRDGVPGKGGQGGNAGVVQIYLGDDEAQGRIQTHLASGEGGLHGELRSRGAADVIHVISQGQASAGSNTEASAQSYTRIVHPQYRVHKNSLVRAWLEFDLIRKHDQAALETFKALGIIPSEDEETEVLRYLESYHYDPEFLELWIEGHPWLKSSQMEKLISTWSQIRDALATHDFSQKASLLSALDHLLQLLKKYQCKLLGDTWVGCGTLPPIGDSFRQVQALYTQIRNGLHDRIITESEVFYEWIKSVQERFGHVPSFLNIPAAQNKEITQRLQTQPVLPTELFPNYAYTAVDGLMTSFERFDFRLRSTQGPVPIRMEQTIPSLAFSPLGEDSRLPKGLSELKDQIQRISYLQERWLN